MASRDTWLLRASSLIPAERYRCYAAVNRLAELGGDTAWLLRPSTFSFRGKKIRAEAGDFLLSGDDVSSASIESSCGALGMGAVKVGPGARANALSLRPPVIGIYHDYGVSAESFVDLVAALRQLGFSRLVLLTSSTIHERLPNVDVLFLPAGDSTIIAQGLELNGAEAIRNYVAVGGCLVGLGESALLPAAPSTPEQAVGPQEQEFRGPSSLLRMIQRDVLNQFSDLPAPSCAYRRFGSAVMVAPFEGEVVVKVMNPAHPLMFGYKGLFSLYVDGPIFGGALGSEGLCTFYKPTEKTVHYLSKSLAWKIATARPAIVSGLFKGGKVVMASARVENPDAPSTWPLLGNMVFYSISDRAISPYEDEGKVYHESALRIADAALPQSVALEKRISSLKLEMEVLTPRLLALLGADAMDAWDSASRAIPAAIRALSDVTRSVLDSAHLCVRARNLRTSIEVLTSSKGSACDSLPSLLELSKAEADIVSVLFTATRALKVLGGMMEQIEKSVTEVASLAELGATMRPDVATIRTLRCSAMTVIAALIGGAPFHSPWYDGEAGPCLNSWLIKGQEGLIAPILGLASGLERSNMRLNHAIVAILL